MSDARTFLTTVSKQTIEMVGGSLVSASSLVWGVLQRYIPGTSIPLFPWWALFAVGIGIYGRAAYVAWQTERTARLAAEEALEQQRAQAEHEREQAAEFNVDVQIGGHYACSDKETPTTKPLTFWLVAPDVVITNRSDRRLPLQLALYFAVREDGAWRTGCSCDAAPPSWVLEAAGSNRAFGVVINVPAFEACAGACAARFSYTLLDQAGVKDIEELVKTRAIWLEIKNNLTGESRTHAVNYLARNIDHADAAWTG